MVISALDDKSRDVRASAVRLSERFLAESNAPVQAALLKHVDDGDWLVREQLAASLGALPPGARETALTSLLERHADDPCSSTRRSADCAGARRQCLPTCCKSTEPSPTRETAITMLTATLVRGAQDAAVQTIMQQVSETTRPAWQRAAMMRGAEVALLGAAAPGSPAGRGGRGGLAAAGRAGRSDCARRSRRAWWCAGISA